MSSTMTKIKDQGVLKSIPNLGTGLEYAKPKTKQTRRKHKGAAVKSATAPAENQNSVPGTHVRWLNSCKSSSMKSDTPTHTYNFLNEEIHILICLNMIELENHQWYWYKNKITTQFTLAQQYWNLFQILFKWRQTKTLQVINRSSSQH